MIGLRGHLPMLWLVCVDIFQRYDWFAWTSSNVMIGLRGHLPRAGSPGGCEEQAFRGAASRHCRKLRRHGHPVRHEGMLYHGITALSQQSVIALIPCGGSPRVALVLVDFCDYRGSFLLGIYHGCCGNASKRFKAWFFPGTHERFDKYLEASLVVYVRTAMATPSRSIQGLAVHLLRDYSALTHLRRTQVSGGQSTWN